MTDERYMSEAILEAKKAADIGEIPIGAVAVKDGQIIGRASNNRESARDPLGHAEIILINNIVRDGILPSFRFEGVTVYVTCEPCVMCIGALLNARVERLVFGCFDPKAGACGSLFDLTNDKRLNHRIETVSGVMADECAGLLSDFFKKLREHKLDARLLPRE